ncbi:MAG: glycosyltransferase family 4 protein [Clostridia bacterium]|nr:glycosyltransferase family 4 protein [Clostridia bacterium]
MKNIWIFNQYNMPPEHGHLNRHYNFGKYLNRKGYKPVVFVGSSLHNSNIQMISDNSLYKIYENCDFPYVFVKTCDYAKSRIKRVYAMFEFYRNLLKVTKNFDKPDFILGSSAHPFAAIAAIKLANKYKCKSIVEVRDLWPETFVAYNIMNKNNPLLRLLYAGEKWIYKNADNLIFTMMGGKDYLKKQGWDVASGGPIDLNKVYHINNGVDLEVFDYNKVHNIIDDEDLNDKSSFNVVYTGSIRLINKIGILLDAAKLLKGTNIKILIWGNGDQLSKLRKRVNDEDIDNVYFKGHVDKKFIPYITSHSNLNIIISENMPLFQFGSSMNKMFDYFASGNPTLFTFKVGYSLVSKYNAGIELDDSSANNIAKSILYFKNLNQIDYDEYTKNARRVAEDYSFNNLTNSLIDILE